MKKLLLFFVLAATVVSVKAQSLSSLFYYEATTTATELLTTTSATYSLAYNPVTAKLYVANRGDQIYIVDPDSYTGTISSINKTLLTKLNKGTINQTYAFSKVRVDADGVIYATAMQTNGTVYIYRWADETSAPTITIFTTVDNPSIVGRVGDSMGIFGTGDNTYLYIAGNSTSAALPGDKIFVFQVIAGVPTYLGALDIEPAKYSTTFKDVAKGSISPEANNILWLGSTDAGVTYRRLIFDLASLTYTSHQVISSSNANSNSPVGEFVKEGQTGFFLSASGRTAAAQNLVTLTKTSGIGTVPTVTFTNIATFNFSKAAHTTSSGYADVAFKRNADNSTTFFVVTAQNYIGAVKTSVALTLPVSLTSFNGSLVKGQSTLAWSTASESNSKGFEILRSTDGQNFASVGFVNSKGENGNSATVLDYTFVDRTAAAGVNYYQLKQMDNDGKSELSKEVVSVNVSLSGDAITVYPNPTTFYVNVSTGGLDFKGFKYEIFDGNGKKVVSQKATSGEQQISVANLAPSVYYLKISKDNVDQKTVKLIKQ